MTTDQDLPMDGQSAVAVFAAKGIDVTPAKDKGVLKIVKGRGLDGDKPMIGDRVTVQFTGRLLNGQKLDSSLDRKDPFSFSLGKGQVIKAWDLIVKTMQKGEVCSLLCTPDYAYGASGNPPKVPPNASLLYEVELLDFQGEMLTEDGGVMRRIKTMGQGFTNPNDGATVDVHLEGRCEGRLFESRDIRFIVGEAEDNGVPLGVDRAMEKMQKGECCLLHLQSKYGFGREGKPELQIGPNKDLLYEVTLRDFKKAKESWEMDLKEKLELSAEVKHKGNQYFKAGLLQQAVIQYQRIVSWLEMECGVGEEQQRKIQEFLLMSQLNLALCFLRLQEFSHVVDNCNKVMELDAKNEKALYRRGEARLCRNEFSLAMADFQQVLEVNPLNRAARAQMTICQRKVREHHEQDKKIYANMFQKFAEHDKKVGKQKRRRDEGLKNNSEVGNKRRRRSQENCCQ
ncbi:hypothetical protein NHX12_029621 [Muraenolepis orangiensis]|uniref:peptidylprolyl isomerase n=1 Tax=Muraenolepis orangiensis TaxID=630683 RepID=A0A9Q0E8A9_9TELE|nr:hypothetical protein NHX12_029621 [Muraenolepis orangiensis]